MRADLRSGLQLAVRAALAVTASQVIAPYLGLEHPIYALLGVVMVMDLSPVHTRVRGLARIVGTVLGAVSGALLSPLLPENPISVGLGILASMLLCALLRLEAGARVAGLVCGIILMSHSDDPWRYGYNRLLETTLGIALAVLVSYAPKLLPARLQEEDPREVP